MDPTSLLPAPDAIPAPAWVFEVLDIVTFTIHILFVNVVIGGSILLTYRLFRPERGDALQPLSAKLPTTFALAINFGVAPLLFVQVIYGQLIYSSSVLMAVFWILVIPLLILAYYGAYVHVQKQDRSPGLARFAMLSTLLITLYIAFTFVNNMTMMLQPETWTAYFDNRGGTLLNVGDPTFIPRYLHFIVASIAVTGLLLALIWEYRAKRGDADGARHAHTGYRVFAIATAAQIVVGFLLFFTLPSEFFPAFLGGNLWYTVVLAAAVLLGVAAMFAAFSGQRMPTLILLVGTVLLMVITRANLRSLYLQDVAGWDDLALQPQYDVLILFLVVFVVGLVSVGWMLRVAFPRTNSEAVS